GEDRRLQPRAVQDRPGVHRGLARPRAAAGPGGRHRGHDRREPVRDGAADEGARETLSASQVRAAADAIVARTIALTSGLAFARDRESHGGCGSYSMASWIASAA